MASPVGVIGAGSFGTAIADLLAQNTEVLLYARRPEVVQQINEQRLLQGQQVHENISATDDLEEVAKRCTLIFPIVPSQSFRSMMRDLRPYLRPYHLLIHGTKGLDISLAPDEEDLSREHIKTMSQVILEESLVRRVGCLSGPNLSAELLDKQPAATLIASHFNEVIQAGKAVLRSRRFQVYGTSDITGAELAGALKNIVALGSGILGGKGLGQNIWALLVTRGLSEMIHIGRAIGADIKAFLGVAGIGDLIATASSSRSRNYTVGYRLARGESLDSIITDMSEVAEGLRTLRTAKALAQHYNISVPITEILYRVLFREMEIDRAIDFLMTFPYTDDVDFL